MKGATSTRRSAFSRTGISIHAPVKGATIRRGRCNGAGGHFNPRSREGSDWQALAFAFQVRYFNPRSREGSDGSRCGDGCGLLISIHAPAKGATFLNLTGTLTFMQFQSTLPQRERHGAACRSCCPGSNISIHAPVKGATVRGSVSSVRAAISIHAPAKGATSVVCSMMIGSLLFQSTLPRRKRHKSLTALGDFAKFQSTLPRRERHLRRWLT